MYISRTLSKGIDCMASPVVSVYTGICGTIENLLIRSNRIERLFSVPEISLGIHFTLTTEEAELITMFTSGIHKCKMYELPSLEEVLFFWMGGGGGGIIFPSNYSTKEILK